MEDLAVVTLCTFCPINWYFQSLRSRVPASVSLWEEQNGIISTVNHVDPFQWSGGYENTTFQVTTSWCGPEQNSLRCFPFSRSGWHLIGLLCDGDVFCSSLVLPICHFFGHKSDSPRLNLLHILVACPLHGGCLLPAKGLYSKNQDLLFWWHFAKINSSVCLYVSLKLKAHPFPLKALFSSFKCINF